MKELWGLKEIILECTTNYVALYPGCQCWPKALSASTRLYYCRRFPCHLVPFMSSSEKLLLMPPHSSPSAHLWVNLPWEWTIPGKFSSLTSHAFLLCLLGSFCSWGTYSAPALGKPQWTMYGIWCINSPVSHWGTSNLLSRRFLRW